MAINLILVGCGNMGYAMLAGWLDAGKLRPDEILVVEPGEELRSRAAALKVHVAAGPDAVPAEAAPALIVLAVKPQVIKEVTQAYRRHAGAATTFVSIAAGTTIDTFEQILGRDTPIMRCMPNTPAAIGKGMMAVYANQRVSDEARAAVTDLLATSGKVAVLDDESQMDAVTAVSGSGPAYVFHFIECLTEAARNAGLPDDTARVLALQTVYGAAALAAQSDEEPGVLRQRVTSPNGTTAAALEVLMGENRLQTLVTEAVEAARRRSIELGRPSG